VHFFDLIIILNLKESISKKGNFFFGDTSSIVMCMCIEVEKEIVMMMTGGTWRGHNQILKMFGFYLNLIKRRGFNPEKKKIELFVFQKLKKPQ